MATDLPQRLPACPLESLRGFLSRDIAKFSHERLDRHNNRLRSVLLRQRCQSLLVLSPQPGGYGLLDVRKRFFVIFALRYATGKSRTLGYDPTVLGVFKCNVEYHC